jgi:mono/diheme cytochrome c family protein
MSTNDHQVPARAQEPSLPARPTAQPHDLRASALAALQAGRYDRAVALADAAIAALLQDGLTVADFVRLTLAGSRAEHLLKPLPLEIALAPSLREPFALRWEALRCAAPAERKKLPTCERSASSSGRSVPRCGLQPATMRSTTATMPVRWPASSAGCFCRRNRCPRSPAPAAEPAAKPAEPPAAPAPAAALDPKEVFKTRCVTCHGESGHGDGPASAALSPKPRNYTDAAWQKSVRDDDIKKVISQGGAAVGKSPLMPAQPDLAQNPAVLDGLVKIIRAFGGS